MNIKLQAGRVPAMLLALLLAGLVAWSPAARADIASTKHNLTPSGPGTFKAPEATGLCTFCHTPHNANGSRALWNRSLSAATYTLYSSTTLVATPTQPTGSSRLCLSCHDGTMAMGTLLRPPGGVQPTLGKLTGSALLGTDLSNDHPISFTYDSKLAADRGELVDPLGAPKALHLDVGGQMQCTSCHDAHADRTKFMRMDPIKGALCTTCHQPTGWTNASHATSKAQLQDGATSPWPANDYTTNNVENNACLSCHRTHAAGHSEGLLAQAGEAANCTICHSGTVAKAGFNFNSEFAKTSRHPIDINPWTHTLKEDASAMNRHVACADCHNGHAADASTAAVPNVSGPLKGVRGINQGGAPVAVATFLQEVCYKCHGLAPATTLSFTRQDNIRNAREQFAPGNLSFHPVAAVGRNTTIPNNSFVSGTGLTATSRIGCGSCHNNDGWTAGGSKPAGPHGSIYKPLLELNYNTASVVTESPTEFALCYKCHDRTVLLNPNAGKFPHARHLTSPANASCAACHDAHGSRTQANLINFMLSDTAGTPVVTPDPTGKITFTKTANGGNCQLACHGMIHKQGVNKYP
jgi:predicted CXXCH cytochrome family protein